MGFAHTDNNPSNLELLQWSREDMDCYTLNELIDIHQKEYMIFCAGQQTANQLSVVFWQL